MAKLTLNDIRSLVQDLIDQQIKAFGTYGVTHTMRLIKTKEGYLWVDPSPKDKRKRVATVPDTYWADGLTRKAFDKLVYKIAEDLKVDIGETYSMKNQAKLF